MFTIRPTADGYEIVDADGNVLATFTGAAHEAYADAVGFLGGLLQFADGPTGDDDGLLPERWVDQDGIAFCEALPGGRDFTECEWSWRQPPRALMLQTENAPAHDGSKLAGFVDTYVLSDDGTKVHAGGRFYDNEVGQQARDILKGGRQFGVSVDPSENVAVEFDCGEWAEDELFGEYCAQEIARFMAYEIAGLTMVPFEGFDHAAIRLASDGETTGYLAAAPTTDDGDGPDAEDSNDTADDSKLAQSVVNYDAAGGVEDKQCEDCAHFSASGPSCQIVQDPIVTAGVCDVFVLSADDANEDANDGTDDGTEDGGDKPMTAAEPADAAEKVERPARKVAASSRKPMRRAAFEVPEPEIGEPFNVAFEEGVLGDDVLVPQYNVVRDALGRFKQWGTNVVGTAAPMTITEPDANGYRQIYGHLTYWGQCHVGNPWGPGKCASVSPSQNGYADFYGAGTTGPLDDASELSCGVLHVGCEHSDAMNVAGVRDAAAHAGLAFAKVRVMDGAYGPWYCGVVLPTVSDDQIDALRALTLSGEWVPELGAVIAVNDGGLPMQRRDRIAASNGSVFVVANRVVRASVKNGELVKLVGGNAIHPCAECAKRARLARQEKKFVPAELIARLEALEALNDRLVLGMETLLGRTAHMRELAAGNVLKRLGAEDE